MRSWSSVRVAEAAGARLAQAGPDAGRAGGPARAVIDSRDAGPGDLFVGLSGARSDGGAFAAEALSAGAWGALVTEAHAQDNAQAPGVMLAAEDPLRALQALARAWRRALGARVVAITGSSGKTSTKDILAALLAPALRTVASSQNLNTEIGLPLAILEAPEGTEALVLELAMRGLGQIAELASVCEPDVGVIVNVGPVHLELLGSVEQVAAAKGELIAGLAPGATAVIPAGEALLEPHLRADVQTVTFGPGGDVQLLECGGDGRVIVQASGERLELELAFSQAHNLQNLLAGVAAARAIGVTPRGLVDVTFSALRGERIALPGNIVVINDCYNANPMSMRAALDDLAATAAGRRIGVLGDMLELGSEEARFHREVGAHARAAGIDLLITVGPRAADIGNAFGRAHHHLPDAAAAAAALPELVRDGDIILVKGSRGVGLEVVAEALASEDSSRARSATPTEPTGRAR
jgi:UDP-N-acetylmuramoyl-tripeptide--D-alanyl-D-alanine ligase